MNAAAKRAFAEARRRHGGLSLTNFMSGYGATATNNPEALWSWPQLAQISNRMTMILMGILLCTVMALYLSASSIEVNQRREPGATQVEKTEPPPTQQAAPAPPAAVTPPKEADSTAVNGAEPTTGRERESSVTTTAAASGQFFKKKLPNGVELNILSSGIEANLLVCLENKAKPERVTWFDFDRLQFETGKTTPQVSSREQLQNIAHILAAYPSVKAMIGGYTDNVGNPGANKRLSKGTRRLRPARVDANGRRGFAHQRERLWRKSPHRDQRHRRRTREKSTNFPRRDPKIAPCVRTTRNRRESAMNHDAPAYGLWSLVVGQVVAINPAHSVRGPKHVVIGEVLANLALPRESLSRDAIARHDTEGQSVGHDVGAAGGAGRLRRRDGRCAQRRAEAGGPRDRGAA